MKVLLIHTYYFNRGGEDVVFENEYNLLKTNNVSVEKMEFHNNNFTFISLITSFFNPISFYKICKKLKTFKPDVVHVHNWHFACSPAVVIACMLYKIPVVHTLHNFRSVCKYHQIYNPSESLNENSSFFDKLKVLISNLHDKQNWHSLWIKSASLTYKYSLLWTKIKKFIVLTEHSKTIYLNSYYRKISSNILIKPNFIFSNCKSISSKEDYILYVGRLTTEKGIMVLIDAIQNTNYKLKIIGDGPLSEEIAQKVAHNNNIELIGFQEFNIVKDYMSKSKVVVFPSISEESFGMIIIEAFAHFTPVIASNFSAMKTIVSNKVNGLLFERNNANSLREKIDELYAMNLEEYSELCTRANNAYNNYYTPEINFIKLMEIYNSVIKTEK